MSLKQNVVEAVGSTKAVLTTSAASVTIGADQTFFNYIPDDIGKLGSFVGIASVLITLYFAWKKNKLEREKMQLEIDILRSRGET